MFTGLLPLLERLPLPNPYINDRSYTLTAFRKHERHLQETQTSLRYNELLPKAYTAFALSLNLPAPPADEALAFGASIGSWPAHPDTVAGGPAHVAEALQTSDSEQHRQRDDRADDRGPAGGRAVRRRVHGRDNRQLQAGLAELPVPAGGRAPRVWRPQAPGLTHGAGALA